MIILSANYLLIQPMSMNDGNVEQYEEEQYDPLTDSYFQNDAINLKVINDQIGENVVP